MDVLPHGHKPGRQPEPRRVARNRGDQQRILHQTVPQELRPEQRRSSRTERVL